MTPELWQRLKPLFHDAMERSGSGRAAFAKQACSGDAELLRNLQALIESAQLATGTLGSPRDNFTPAEPPRFHAGELILGRFRILRPIGAGGMGEVYEAEDLQLGRIALKTIRAGIASSSEAFHHFRQEVQLARKVGGAQVCRIHEFYLLPATPGHPATAFLTMEYLEGETLQEMLRAKGPLPASIALRIALDICEGLRLVHAQGIIHRDLKSGNIMLCGRGDSLRAVLMDFGLARAFDASPTARVGTNHGARNDEFADGAIVGTPAYMAPEQFEGKPLSSATDIYALGIVLYELATGIHPYAAPTPVAAAIRRAQTPAPVSSIGHSVPRKWDRIIQRCLQYEPVNRYQSAEQVAAALRAGPANLDSLRQDRPWVLRLAAALLLASLAWGAFSWWQIQQYYRPGPKASAWYNEGVASIREGNYVKATRLFQAAINEDRRYGMAHVRMAEALYNLDFQGAAQQELLIALPARRHLTPLDAVRLDAIQATVIGDAAGAAHDYETILNKLPSGDKSFGDVDAGSAYERAGDVSRALESYRAAIRADSRNAAAYMHIAVLQSRMHHVQEGEQAFAEANTIFTAEMNAEGLAELDYERGYAANDRGDSKDAEPLLEKAHAEAQAIQSVQLQIRALTQLSSAEYNSYKDTESVEHANEAIQLARDNQLESWAANGLVQLANALLDQGHFAEAEKPLDEAMQVLRQSPQPRVQAMANLTLASLMNQEHRPERVIEPAQAALTYYRANGFLSSAFDSSLLMTRAERDLGQYDRARASSNDLLTLATQSEMPLNKFRAEELAGTIYLNLEQYPDALAHFEEGLRAARNGTQRSYQELHCGETLFRLGRYPESDAMLKLASENPKLAAGLGEVQVESLLSQQKYRAAFELAQSIVVSTPDVMADRKRDLERDQALAAAHLGMSKQAAAGLSASLAENAASANPADAAAEKLDTAEIDLWMGMNHEALEAAMSAHAYFASSGKLSSDLRSSYVEAAAFKAMKDKAEFDLAAKKALDIRGRLQQDWGPDSFQTYISRPDLHSLQQRAAQ